ncbi:MAG: hypothetical protein ACI9OJ_002750 [Myxococcota bacterium]
MSKRRTRQGLAVVYSVLAGLLAGTIVGAASMGLYLIVFSPALAAIAAGWMTSSAARAVKLPGPRFVTILGGVSGILAMLAILVVTLEIERSYIITALSSAAGLGDEAIARGLKRWQQEATGGAGGIGALYELRITSGVRLFGETWLDLGTAVNGILLLVECGLAGLIGARLGRSRASEPFCDNCDSWYSRRIVGTAQLGALASIRAELQAGRHHRLGRRLEPPKGKGPVVMHCLMCDTCSLGDVTFELEVAENGRRPRVIRSVEAPHSALDAIMDSQALRKHDAAAGH